MTTESKLKGVSDERLAEYEARLDSMEASIVRLEAVIRQLYQLESRFKPGSFRDSEPMSELREILEEQ